MAEKIVDVIGIREENCTNCHQCIAVCPVKICSDGSGDVVKFNNNLCIGCGRCVEACIKSHGGESDKSARYIIDDTNQFSKDIEKKEIYCLVAPSAQSNFDLKKLITALKLLGARGVYDVSLGAEISIAAYHQAIESGKAKIPIIAQPCPAIVKYIELEHPRLIEHLAPVGSPMHCLAVYIKSLHPNAELAFISPCLAKRREIRENNLVKYNVTFQSLTDLFHKKKIDLATLADGDFDHAISAGIATNYSSPGGLKESYLFHYPETPASSITRVEGPIVFEQYLPDLEKAIMEGKPNLPLMIDILSCEKGCNMGAGCINHQRSIDEIEYAVARRSELSTSDKDKNRELDQFINNLVQNNEFEYHNYKNRYKETRLRIPTEEELQKIYFDMHKLEEKDFRNCAACGYNSCYFMAVAVFNGLNKAQNCHLYKEKELRQEQQAILNLHNELSNVFETMSDGVIVLDKNARVTQSNPTARQIIGYQDDKLIGVHIVDLFSGQAPKTLDLLESGQQYEDVEILLEGRRGQVHATASAKPTYDENNQVNGATVILRPIAQVQQVINKFSGAQANFTFDSIIGESKQLKKSINLAEMASQNMSNVLIQAESGTGKEVFAQAIHNASSRSNGPFVAINCAALPRELIGSELFGYTEGAFTGAKRGGRLGKFELANKGTLLLDEIGDMPLEQQAILLRAIQEKAITRVGGDTLINVDVRIIAATNQNLLKLVEEGRFRADLYYRLNVVQINIPPLRERLEDIELLFNFFIETMSPKLDRHITEVQPAVIKCLQAYDWPGNVRELQNIVERILLVCEDGKITITQLPQEIVHAAIGHNKESWEINSYSPPTSAPVLNNRHARKLAALEQEKEMIIQALNMNGGNVTKASAALGISRNTLYRKMKSYEIEN
ncbi:MAG: sigma 54-interacting transcriptional regulator [Syntrophomonadaceae bacterium]|nr:sigma 54-interacting transcriptional regulator [Syntrophomonadaceae bacterium]